MIETQRLRLRRVTRDDLAELVAIHADPDITRFMGAFDHDEATKCWPASTRLGPIADTGAWRSPTARPDACSAEPDWRTFEFGETELGWTLRRDAWGNGYATEAARACADWAFRELQLPYLISLIEPRNDRSISVANRLGMSPLGNDIAFDRSMIVYAVRREHWLAT